MKIFIYANAQKRGETYTVFFLVVNSSDPSEDLQTNTIK